MPSDDLRNAAAGRAPAGSTSTAVAERQQPAILRALADPAQIEGIEAALPEGCDKKRFLRMAVLAMKNSPDLMELGEKPAGLKSILSAILRCATLDLEPNNDLGHAYLIAFKKNAGRENETIELNFIIGYKGILKLAADSGNLARIDVHEVYENDPVFEVEYGTGPNAGIQHKPFLRPVPGGPQTRGDIYCYYLTVHFHDGGFYFLHMTLADIEERKNRSASAGGARSPWNTDKVAMSKKTLVRAAAPYLRLHPKQAEGIEADEKVVEPDGTFTHVDPETARNAIDAAASATVPAGAAAADEHGDPA